MPQVKASMAGLFIRRAEEASIETDMRVCMRMGRFFSLVVFCLAVFWWVPAGATDGAGSVFKGYTQERYSKDKENAEKGDAKAQFIMGYLHYSGLEGFTSVDLEEAFAWYEKAARQGHVQACQIIGLMYQQGNGVARNTEKAKQWYQYAADRGLRESQYALGVLYAEGAGVPRDEALGMFWLRRSDAQKFPPAPLVMGVMYAEGRGVKQDDAQAFSWFARSAELGNPEGMLRVAGMYRMGVGVDADMAISIRWLEEAYKADTRASLIAANDLSWLLSTTTDAQYRDTKRALDIAEGMVKKGATSPSNLDTLAAAYAANGEFEKAIKAQEAAITAQDKAIAKITDAEQVELKKVLEQRLNDYKQGKPWLEP